MKTRPGTLAAYACAGLFLMSLFACAASRGPIDPIPVLPFWWGDDVRVAIATNRASWGLYYVRDFDVTPEGWYQGGIHHRAFGFELEWQGWGVSGTNGWKHRAWSGAIAVPTALMLPLLAAFPVRHFHRQHTARRRARSGRCLNCGYDLRSSPQRCPECGTESRAAATT